VEQAAAISIFLLQPNFSLHFLARHSILLPEKTIGQPIDLKWVGRFYEMLQVSGRDSRQL
jgi:hypothetical protein